MNDPDVETDLLNPRGLADDTLGQPTDRAILSRWIALFLFHPNQWREARRHLTSTPAGAAAYDQVADALISGLEAFRAPGE